MQLYYLETIKKVLILVNKQVHDDKYGTFRILTTTYYDTCCIACLKNQEREKTEFIYNIIDIF